MDIREISTPKLLGNSIGFFAPMNGGKTEAEIQELRRAEYYGLNSIAYNHVLNSRETDLIVVDGKYEFPAKTAQDISWVKKDLEKRIEKIMSPRIGYQGKNGKITIDGVTHRKHQPLAVVGIDEANLFCLTEEEATKMIEFMGWCKSNNIALLLSALLYDFRQMKFGHVHSILPYIDIRQEKKPACMALYSDWTKCTDTAKHTQRVWSIDFVKETGLQDLLDNMDFFNYMDKDKCKITSKYVPAPFFDKTVRIEEEKDKKVIYLPVCTNCAVLPYKEETFKVYDAIIRGDDPHSAIENRDLTEAILSFLVGEKWVRKAKKKFYPISYFRNRIGGFSPEKKRPRKK